MDFDAGSRRERELFADCVLSTESKALRHLFFAEREAAKIPDVPKDTPARTITRAAVVGAGTMGGGIAMTYANAGIPVLLKDVDQAALDRGLATIRKNYESSVSKGKMTAEASTGRWRSSRRRRATTDLAQVDIVVEAVFENMDLKKSTFAELGRSPGPTASSRRTRRRSTSTSSRGQRPAGAGHRPPLLQPGERDEAARNRPRARDEQGSHRHIVEARPGS